MHAPPILSMWIEMTEEYHHGLEKCECGIISTIDLSKQLMNSSYECGNVPVLVIDNENEKIYEIKKVKYHYWQDVILLEIKPYDKKLLDARNRRETIEYDDEIAYCKIVEVKIGEVEEES